jgi:hypothetical protein
MSDPERWARVNEPLRGAGYVIALAVLLGVAGTGIAALMVWIMT